MVSVTGPSGNRRGPFGYTVVSRHETCGLGSAHTISGAPSRQAEMQRRPLRELRHDSSADMPEISGAALLTQRSCRSYCVRQVFERRHVTSPGIPPTHKCAGERIHPRLRSPVYHPLPRKTADRPQREVPEKRCRPPNATSCGSLSSLAKLVRAKRLCCRLSFNSGNGGFSGSVLHSGQFAISINREIVCANVIASG